jgi:tRNA A-37 threonylcarbamoyl transferase component Bud32
MCPHCGAALAADSPEGLCPRCLLQESWAEEAAPAPPNGTTSYPSSFVPPSPEELAQHFPQLEILELLGQGGMGAVYKARQRKLDRLVAVKILPPDWGKDPAFAERFDREAKALARLTHPHIVTVHDFGERDGLFYLVMEYVDGANLRHILQQGRLEPAEALAIIPQICDALQYAHEEGVVHRDIKPENILLDSKGRVKIADFGLAKLLNRPRAVFTLTGSRQVMGTLDYMAPEQRTHPQDVDHRADIYSLGVVFYEMLTGELPLGRFAPPSHKTGVDARLDGIVFRALEREPERRYQRFTEVKADLDSLRAGVARPLGGIRNRDGTEAADPNAVRFRVVPPAAGLIFTGLVVFAQGVILAALLLTMPPDALRHEGILNPIIVLGLFLTTAIAGVFVVGGVKLMRLDSYTWPLVAAIWAVLPFSYAWIIGLPFGIWTLLLLRKPEVRAAFRRGRQEPDESRDHAQAGASEWRAPPRQTTGPIQRRLRGFVGSLYSLMVHSRVEQRAESRAEMDSREPVVVAAAPAQPRSKPDHPRRAKRGSWLFWLGTGAAILILSLLAFGFALLLSESKSNWNLSQERPPFVVLGSEYESLVTTLGLDSYIMAPRVREVFQATERDYLALEARFTKRQRDHGGNLKVTILPFRDKASDLDRCFRAKLVTVLGPGYPNNQARNQLPREGELFPFGQEEVRIEIRPEGGWYHGKVYRGAKGAADPQPAEEFDGPRIPKMYERFWTR